MESRDNEMCITSTLACFQGKIEEAISLVQSMSTEDKLKAVQYWNAVSENLQDVVNSSADDISALASQLSERENLIAREHMKLCSTDLPQLQRPVHQQPTYSPMSTGLAQLSCPQGVKSFHQNHDETNHPAMFALENKQPGVSNIGADLLDHYLATQQNIGSTSVVQHPLSVMVEQCNSFGADESLEAPLPDALANSNLPHNHVAVQEVLSAEGVEHVDDDDPLPLPEVHFSAGDSQEFGVDDLEVSIPPAPDVPSHGDPTVPQKNELGNDENPKKCPINTKNKKSASVLSFCTKRARNPEDKGDDCHVYVCNICQKCYPSIGSFNFHFAVHSKQFICHQCGASCESRKHLRAHERTHNGIRVNKCSDCGREFKTFGNLKRHMRTHTGDRPFECTVCNKRFREKKSLQTHGRVHSGERPYQCNMCPSRFVQLSGLNNHLDTHGDVKRHLCDVCGKSFRQKVQLKTHKLRHEGKKSFRCEKCPIAFDVFNDLQRHRRCHLQDKPFKCEECGKSFPRQLALTEHLNRHYGNKPYQCTVCPKSYADMSACHKHMKTHGKTKAPGASRGATSGSAVSLPPVDGL